MKPDPLSSTGRTASPVPSARPMRGVLRRLGGSVDTEIEREPDREVGVPGDAAMRTAAGIARNNVQRDRS